jgi:hypothetical protein
MAGFTGSIPVTGLITPTDTSDKYPVIDPLYGIDGFRNVESFIDRDNIPVDRRRQGMVVGAKLGGEVQYFKLKSTPWNMTSNDWDLFIPQTFTQSPSIKYYIANENITVPSYYQYLVYGDLTIGPSGSLVNYGHVTLINGTMSVDPLGTFSNFGTFSSVFFQPTLRYATDFTSYTNTPISITHSLGTVDITYSVREGNNFIQANIEIIDANVVSLTTTGTVSGRINIMG